MRDWTSVRLWPSLEKSRPASCLWLAVMLYDKDEGSFCLDWSILEIFQLIRPCVLSTTNVLALVKIEDCDLPFIFLGDQIHPQSMILREIFRPTCPFIMASIKKEKTADKTLKNSGPSSPTRISSWFLTRVRCVVSCLVFENFLPRTRWASKFSNPQCFQFEHIGIRGNEDSSREEDRNEPCTWGICWVTEPVFLRFLCSRTHGG